MTYITDEMRRARRISAWESRYREHLLPVADNHPEHFTVHLAHPNSEVLAYTVQEWVRRNWRDAP